MRNLKRTLCLAMAAVMMLSMMIIGAGAVSYDDLTDKDQIVHEEAVAIMNSLGLIVGRDDGSFDPTANITRAEMCKVITLALHGGSDPVLSASNSTFWDTKGHWAELYIEYCAANGIIAGRGDGSFDPNSNITGTEAAKMVLVALGYKSDVFYFTGPDWAINVDTRANDSHARLYDGLSGLNSGAAINRDNAAQLLYNGVINAELLEMSPQQSITTGEVSYQWTWTGTTMLNVKFDAHVYEGVVVANEYASLDAVRTKDGQFSFEIIMQDDQTTGSNVGRTLTVAGDTTPNMLGKSYKMIIGNTQKGGVHTTVYGEATLSTRNNICTITASKNNAKAVTDEMKKVGINDITGKTYKNFDLATIDWTNDAAVKSNTGNGIVIEIIDNNNDGKAEYVLVNKPFIGKVSSYNVNGNNGDGYITIGDKSASSNTPGEGEYITGAKFADVVGSENLAKDDIVSYVKLPNGKFYVTKLDSVTGTVTRTTGNDTTGKDELRLDTTTYKQSALSGKFDDDASANLNAAVSLGKEATLYLDSCGNVVYVTAPEAETKYLYVEELEVQGPITGIYAKVVFSDGTSSTVQIESVSDGTNEYKGSTGAKALMTDTDGENKVAWKLVTAVSDFFGEGSVCKYTESNGKYKLTDVTASVETNPGDNSSLDLKKGDATLSEFTGVKANSRTVFVVKSSSGSSWSAYTGIANVPNLSGITKAAFALGDNNVADIAFITGTTDEGTSKSVYILSNQVTAMKDGNKDVYTVKALVDGEYVAELILDGYNGGTPVSAGLYRGESISVNGNTVRNLLGITPVQPSEVKGPTSGSVVEGTVVLKDGTSVRKALTVDSSTKFVVIAGANQNQVTEGSIDDISYDETPGAKNTNIIMTQKSDSGSGQYVAGVIYIFR